MLLQATGVAVKGSAIVLTGPPGIGKSSLALALIDRGATLIGDDGISLEHSGPALIASPPPNIAGLLEVRGVGLITFPTTSAPVALLVALGEQARGDGERMPTALPTTDLGDVPVPTLHLAAPDWSTALKVEQALAHFGTRHPMHSD